MATLSKRAQQLCSAEGDEIRRILREMSEDSNYITEPSYTSNSALYPNNLIPFEEAHMEYLIKHADVNPAYYLSNLRLMLRNRSK